MAGRGPAPKDPGKRARRNADPVPTTTIRFERGEQPDLPGDYLWPEQTRVWWANWSRAPQAEHFMQTDWDFLLDTALIHAELWAGNAAVAGELRLRVSKVGSTAEDRARLRISFAEADERDAARPAGSAARERYGSLRAVAGEGGSVTPIKAAPVKRAAARRTKPAE
ncbi:hypothetical protein ABT336_24230 [Micromonospora sp. NPDC000207]|uniref:phage terminase small subunit n=1 Tax=Micromonospora sp. NPDC000207 TaxID=3154246 RepID=UPI0033248FC2